MPAAAATPPGWAAAALRFRPVSPCACVRMFMLRLELHYFHLLWICCTTCCTTSPQQSRNKSNRRSFSHRGVPAAAFFDRRAAEISSFCFLFFSQTARHRVRAGPLRHVSTALASMKPIILLQRLGGRTTRLDIGCGSGQNAPGPKRPPLLYVKTGLMRCKFQLSFLDPTYCTASELYITICQAMLRRPRRCRCSRTG